MRNLNSATLTIPADAPEKVTKAYELYAERTRNTRLAFRERDAAQLAARSAPTHDAQALVAAMRAGKPEPALMQPETRLLVERAQARLVAVTTLEREAKDALRAAIREAADDWLQTEREALPDAARRLSQAYLGLREVAREVTRRATVVTWLSDPEGVGDYGGNADMPRKLFDLAPTLDTLEACVVAVQEL